MSERVTIGVPVYKGERFLDETLRCIRAQTWHDIRVVMSVDGPDPACEAICAAYLDDPCFELFVQPERLGWVGNINWCMAQVEDGYWYFHQQDDITHPTYITALLGQLRANPSAALAYCDVQGFGANETRFVPVPSVRGETAFVRQVTMLHEHLPAFAFRGLARAAAAKTAGPILTNDVDNYGVDTTWLAGVARAGELIRHPEVLYRKRYHDRNTESRWWAWPRERKLEAWAAHCVDMVNQALRIVCSASEARLLFLAGLERLGSAHTARTFLGAEPFTSDERRTLYDTFMTRMRRAKVHNLPLCLDARWPRIRRLAEAGFWMPRAEALEIRNVGPQPVTAGQPFNVQPDGCSAIWVKASAHIPAGSRIQIGEDVLATVVQGPVATAVVPPRLTDRPGSLPLRIIDPDGRPLCAETAFTIRDFGDRNGCPA